MFIARAAAIAIASSEMIDSTIINIRVRIERGGVSVGLKAVAVVNARKI
jgi:hypothetical protein